MKNISKILFVSAVSLSSALAAFAAAPRIMIVPDKTWCTEKGYIIEHNRNGKVIPREDYDKALIDKDFKNVQLAIAQVFAERGFPVVSGEAQQEDDEFDEMLDEAVEGAQTGSGVQTDAYDELIKQSKPDILLKIGWNVNTIGTLYSCDYRMDAIDSYSNKQIAPLAGQTGERRRTVPLSVALKATAKANMDDFTNTLMQYFATVENEGREIKVDIRIIGNGAGITMSSEFGGRELGDIIYTWLNDNTVNHQFNRRSTGRNMARYNEVKIPLRDTKNRPMDATVFVDNLKNYLKTLGIESGNKSFGLGNGRLYIGEK